MFRLLGDLIYLDVVSVEGEKYCITAHTRGFYINRSTGNVLDAQPSKPVKEATTLVGLLRQVSEKFATGTLLDFFPLKEKCQVSGLLVLALEQCLVLYYFVISC
jgi:hypothetical protein